MAQPWEADTDVSTKALSCYNVLLRSGPSTTKTAIYATLNHHSTARATNGAPVQYGWEQDDGGALDGPLSSAYVDDGVAHLVSLGFVTLVGDTVTATKLTSGSPAPIRRMKGDDLTLEYGVQRVPNGSGGTNPP